MLIALLVSAMIAVGWLTVRSMNREKARHRRAAAIAAAARTQQGGGDLYVSLEDSRLVGLSAGGATLVLGRGEDTRAVPAASLLAVEGLRDGQVMIRAELAGDPVTPTPMAQQTVADLPDRILSLGLRVTVESEAFEVLFFDGGRHGVSPSNEAFRKQAAQTEAWFKRLSTAMRLARA